MSDELKRRQVKARAKAGLEILYATSTAGDGLDDVQVSRLPGELRERYWIEAAKDVGRRNKPWPVEVLVPWRIGRHELGRARDDPGDGFRYVYHAGTGGAGDLSEWFEVTEVFEGVHARDVEAFMRVNNGGTSKFPFDPDGFVRGLDMGTPCRAAQRRAADKVIAAVKKKMKKESYADMWREYGYGTLVVGLPLWFATPPADPLRVNNVIDDFWTRVVIGLDTLDRQLAMKKRPFWRIVVIWSASHESLGELRCKIRDDAYAAVNRRIGGVPLTRDSPFPSSKIVELALSAVEGSGRFSFHIKRARYRKQAQEANFQLPPRLAEQAAKVKALSGTLGPSLLECVKWRFMQRALALLCFVRIYGLSGLEHWVVAKLSPHHGLTRLIMRGRAVRLYRISRRRQAAKKRRLSTGDPKVVLKRGR